MNVETWLGKENKLGHDIWHGKYQHNNETFDQWIDRVSGGNQNIRNRILKKQFLFGGRILAMRGVQEFEPETKSTYSNCYVISAPEDNLESIFECAGKLGRIFSFGGGVGVDLSKLAPRGAKVRNAAKESSGAVSFMDLYSTVTGLISQNGRRGALMLSMKCDHPDIEEFIDIKTDLSKVTKANTSVRATDEFMKAACEDAEFELSFVREETGETIWKMVKAKDLLMKLAYNNWDMGEPGILFWDRITDWNLLSNYSDFEYAGVNPCAEEPLPAGGACLLGSINLSEFVTAEGNFDFEDFDDAVFEATIALNEVLDEGLSLHPLQEQKDSVRDWRQIGLGVFGIADMLIKMGVRYGSQESFDLCDTIGEHMINYAMAASAMLAQQEGTFPKFDLNSTLDSSFYEQNVWDATDKAVIRNGLRNSQLLTIAPTGTLSTMLGVSGGIEPIFANSYERKTESLHGEDVYYKVYTPIVEKYMVENGLTEESELPGFFVTAKDIPFSERIAMQSVWQKHIDASISSTVNLPFDAKPQDVYDLYMSAHSAGLKGITVFRDGCRRASILTTAPAEENKSDDVHEENKSDDVYDELSRGYVLPTSDDLIGLKRKLITGCGSLHVNAYFDPHTGELRETFFNKGSAGGCINSLRGLSRMISLSARSGLSVHQIVDQLCSGESCGSYTARRVQKKDTSKGANCPMAVGYALLDMWNQMQKLIENQEDNEQPLKAKEKLKMVYQTRCPECGEPVIHEGGCDICKACGYSKCG